MRHSGFEKLKFAPILMLALLVSVSPQAYAQNQQLRAAFSAHLPPYHFVDENGEYVGLHIDILNWIAKKKKIDVKLVAYETDGECLRALKSGEVDILLGHKTGDGAVAELQYTAELTSSYLCLIASNEVTAQLINTNDYNFLSAVIEFGLAASSSLTRLGIRSYLAKGNQVQVLEELIEGNADLALAVNDSGRYLLRKTNLMNRYSVVRRYISPVSHAMLLRSEDWELFNALDTGLTELRATGQYDAIYRKWIPENEAELAQHMNERITKIVLIFIGAVMSILGFFFILNRLLKKQVREKTKELHEANRELDRQMIKLQSESRIRYGMIEYSPNSMVSFNTDYRGVLANQAAMALCGLKKNIIGHDVRMLNVFGEILSNVGYDIFSLEHYSEKVNHPAILMLEKDGEYSYYRYNLYRSRDEKGISNVLLTVENATAEERKKQEMFEKEKTRTINRLVASIAHEIKNPLMTIRTAVSLLKTKGDDQKIQEAFIRFVPDEVDRINRLVEGLINYARPAKGQGVIVNLSELVNECMSLINVALEKNRFRIEADLCEHATVFVNRDRIKQSLINIVLNGVESMDEKQHLHPEAILKMNITVKADEKYSSVTIRDEGMGMTPNDIRHCTEPYYSTKKTGTGLGLSLVKQFVEDNSGTFVVRSKKNLYTECELKFRRAATAYEK
jgi:polar amino acid transport system substrate-binding protein